ncbi:unnamed protein product [Paramecium primaurelia]|uniref:Uncharacterized protein n=1 Tax=Paramecium primaurelia TaxID=5886 RepID=A0A8S1NAY1_PARPR|nr:unnamed protein product [Paramecium primaurelia]
MKINNNNNNDTQNSQAQKNFNQLIKLEADDFKRQFKFIDKEKLFMELQNYKIENNYIKEENTKLRTRIQQTEKELLNYERLCENMTEQTPNKKKANELLLIQLKKQNKDLQQQLKERTVQVEHLKKNTKVTKFQELECDRKAYFDETIRMRKLIEESQSQFQSMLSKYNQSLQLESEVQKLLKTNENLIAENKALNQKTQQSDEKIRQLQQLYKKNQQQQQTLENQIQDQKNQIKKLQIDKTNLKQTIKQIQDTQYQQLQQAKPKKEPTPRQPQLPNLILEELRFKLIYRGITVEQFADMLEGLKQQAREQNVTVKIDDLRHIFAQEPFSYTDDIKVQSILNSLTGHGNQLVENLKSMIGNYKTFMNFPTFDFELAQTKMKAQLKQNKKKIQEFWNKQKIKGDVVTKSDVRKMLNSLQLNWQEPENLFYFLQLFEKSGENLQQIPLIDTYDPFTQEDPSQQQQMTGHQNMRISEESDEELLDKQSQDQGVVFRVQGVYEESDEELFDKQSQDYSLDENAAKKKKEQDQGIVFRDEGQIVEQQEKQQQEYEQQQEFEQASEFDQQQNKNYNENEDNQQKASVHDSQEKNYQNEQDEYQQDHQDEEQDGNYENEYEDQNQNQQNENNNHEEQQYENEEFD